MRALTAAAVLPLLVAGCLEAPPQSSAPPPPPPDADIDGDAGTVALCEAFFGTAPDYLLCGWDEISCTFYLRLRDGIDFTCVEACAEFGTECLDGYADTDQDDHCEIDTHDGCGGEHEDQICVCLLPQT